MEAEEADRERDNIDFEGGRDANVALLSLDNPGGGARLHPDTKRRQRRWTGGGKTSTLRVIATTWDGVKRRRR